MAEPALARAGRLWRIVPQADQPWLEKQEKEKNF